MRGRVLFLLGVGVFLLGGCGGSKHSSSAAATTAHPGSTRQAGTATTSTLSSSAPTGTTTTQAGSAAATNARVPATFAIEGGGKLTPASVSIPAFLAIELTAISGDGRPHTMTVNGRVTVTLHVPPRGSASALMPGLRAGRYPVIVDGAKRGTLVIGGEPGP